MKTLDKSILYLRALTVN